MRLAPTFLLISLFSLILPSIASSLDNNHNPRASRTIAARQHRPKRTLLDLCAYVDLSVLQLLGIDLDLKLCLCLSALPLTLQTNLQLKALVRLLGEDGALKLLTSLITGLGQQCHYPPHAKPICDNHCGFECTDGYKKVGKTCVCAPPMVECRGKCALSCPSATPLANTKRTTEADNSGPVRSVSTRMVKKRHNSPRPHPRHVLQPRHSSGLLSGLNTVIDLGGGSMHHGAPSDGTTLAIIHATKELIDYTNELYAGLATIIASPGDNSSTVLIKSTIAVNSQVLMAAVANLLDATTSTDDLITYANAVVRADKLVATSLAALSGHESWLTLTKKILDATLALLSLCDSNSNPLPPTPPAPTTTVASPHPTAAPVSSNDPIFVDLHPLLTELGLGGIWLPIWLDLDGLLGTTGLNELTNDLLASLNLGGTPAKPVPGGSPPPTPASGTLLGLDLNALITSLLDLDLDSTLASLGDLGAVTNYDDLVAWTVALSEALLALTLDATNNALNDTVKLLNDLEGSDCGRNNDTMSALLGLIKSSLLGTSPNLLEIKL
ncbi:hypothetical protein PLEOSDRAFT_1090797 [Pleurotus ostreatus PC15]|uniref:Uncharacterized protein n=1 Tax=Pleurotus ostreatus (strain PC15) TaxID=1137138 RepID=A0A067N8K5_PLEO1|nr:hypothetical protein PLEOSDRAFT_1090797 [Pleurotus ostreatus PC15]